MKCIICRNGELRPGLMTATLEQDRTTVVTKNVPANICDNCGEGYLTQEITSELLKQVADAAKSGVQVDVRKYTATAA